MENKDGLSPHDLSSSSIHSMNPGYSNPNNFTASFPNPQPMNFMYPPFFMPNQMGSFPTDPSQPRNSNRLSSNFIDQGLQTGNRNTQSQSGLGTPQGMMMPNFEMMQNAMRMYGPQMGMGNMMDPMQFFGMMNAMQMFMQSMGGINNPMASSINKNLSFMKKSDSSTKVEEMFKNNVQDLTQFYSYINAQNVTPQRQGRDESLHEILGHSQTNRDSPGDNQSRILSSSINQRNDSSRYELQMPEGPFIKDSRNPTPHSEEQRQRGTYQEDRANRNVDDRAFRATFQPTEDNRPIKGAQNYSTSPTLFSDKPLGQQARMSDERASAGYNNQVDDRPIRPAQKNPYLEFEERPVGGGNKNAMNFDEMPIRGAQKQDDMFGQKGVTSGRGARRKADREEQQTEVQNEPQYEKPVVHHDLFDDIPITGKPKRFEDLLEEQLRQNPGAVGRNDSGSGHRDHQNKNYLKRGSGFMSSAAMKKGQKEALANSYEQYTSQKGTERDYSSRPMTSGANRHKEGDSDSARPKEAKKFLAKGAGIGGGKGANSSMVEESAVNSSSVAPNMKKRDSKVPDTTYDRIMNQKYTGQMDQGKKGKNRSQDYDDDEEDSFEKEYNMEKYVKSSGRKQKKTPDSLRGPNYQFDDEHEFKDEKRDVAAFRDQDSPASKSVDRAREHESSTKKKMIERAMEQSRAATLQNEQEGGNLDKYVQQKINDLNAEIAKFKGENEKVRKLRLKHEEMLKNLQREIDEWSSTKDREIKELEEWKSEEREKIKREKKEADKLHKNQQSQPNKKEREEIEALKKQLLKIQEDLAKKEKKAKDQEASLKAHIEELSSKNLDLHDEIKYYEQLRLKGINPSQAPPFKSTRTHVKTQESKSAAKRVEREDEDEDDVYGKRQAHEEEEEEQEEQEGENEEEYEQTNKKYNELINRSNPNVRHPSLGGSQPSKAPKEQEKRGINKSVDLTDSTKKKQRSEIGRSVEGFKTEATPKREFENKGNKGEISFDRPSVGIPNSQLDEDYKFDANPYYQRYMAKKNELNKIVNQNVSTDGKIQRSYADGKKEVVFHNGVRREIMPDGYTIVHFTNNDIKQTLPDNTVIYYFAEAQTSQTTTSNGQNVLIYRFANHQVEFHNPDGSKDIQYDLETILIDSFADGTKKYIAQNQEEETIFSDGTIQRIDSQKIKSIEYTSGQKDVVYPDGLKVRTYPDGRVKKYYPNGEVEEINYQDLLSI